MRGEDLHGWCLMPSDDYLDFGFTFTLQSSGEFWFGFINLICQVFLATVRGFSNIVSLSAFA